MNETTETTSTETASPVTETTPAAAAEAPAVATIDPDYSGPIGPGVIADQAAYDAAVASGALIELSPEDVAQLDVSHHLELHEAKQAAEAAKAEAAALRAELAKADELLAIASQERAELRTLKVGRAAPLNSAAVEAFAQGVSRTLVEEPQPARKRRRPFRLELDKRQDSTESLLKTVVGTLGLPRVWARVLGAAAPAIGVAARELVQSLDDDSPGGRRITRDELEEIAELAAARLKTELLEEFIRG